MAGIFITSTGTGIGKTYVTQRLLEWDQQQQQRFTASKPVISGWPEYEKDIQHTDTAILLQAGQQLITSSAIEAISPWRFFAPLTPDMAAKKEGRAIHPNELISFCQAQLNLAKQQDKLHLIEGVGGVMSPIAKQFTGLDWIHALRCPSLLVVGSYLGTLSHTLTAITALQRQTHEIMAVVVNESPNSTVSLTETVEYLSAYLSGIKIIGLGQQCYSHDWGAIPELYTYLSDKLELIN